MNDADLIEGRMGRGVLRAVARFVESWEGSSCAHPDRPQVAGVGELGSTCWPCAWRTAAVEGWSVGPCSICNAATDHRGDRVWLVEAAEEVVVAVRLCPSCESREVASTALAAEKGDEMSGLETTIEAAAGRCCGHCRGRFTAWAAGGSTRCADLPTMHEQCRRGLLAALSGFSRRNPQVPRDTRRAVVLAAARLRFGSRS